MNSETLDSLRTVQYSTNPMSNDRKDDLPPVKNFREAVMKIASTDPTKPLTNARKSVIDKHIREFFNHIQIPDHPTYSLMIHRAIEELNEEGGSSEESISNFIIKEYNNLPWAHSTLLKHHLGKLCGSGEIVLTFHNSYLLSVPIMELKPSSSCGSKRKETKGKRSKKKGRKWNRPRNKKEIAEYQLKELIEVIEEQNQVLEDHTGVIDKQNQAQNTEVMQSCDDVEKGDGSKLKLCTHSLEPMEKEKKQLSEEKEQLMKSQESFDIVGLVPQQQLDLPISENSSSIAELTQEKHRQLRTRYPKAGSLTATATTISESLPSQYQHEQQQQPECPAEGWLAQPKPDMATVVKEMLLSASQHQQEEQQQPSQQRQGNAIKRRGWGRPKNQQEQLEQPECPQPKPDMATMSESLLSQDQHEQQQPECPAEGWLAQPKPDMATVVEEMLLSANQHQQEEQQQPSQQRQGNAPKRRGRGRPKKQQEQLEQPNCPQPKPDMATVVEKILLSANQHQPEEEQQQPKQHQGNASKRRGQGRPKKQQAPKKQQEQLDQLECRSWEGPKQPREQLEQPERRGRGRPKKKEQPEHRGWGDLRSNRAPKPKPTISIDINTW